MPTVLITPEAMREVDGPYAQALRDAGFDIRYPRNPEFARGLCDTPETIDELRDVDATIASNEAYSEEVLRALPRMRVIARCGVGYDRVDVPSATARRIPVTITPTTNREAVAELALTLLLAVSKSIPANDRHVRAGRWPRDLLLPVRGRTLGIFGLGRIGCCLAVRARALGMKVVATETAPDATFVRDHEIVLADFRTLLASSDFVSIHCPLNDTTRGLFDEQVFSRMKRGSILINTARGAIVDEQALVAALRSGHLAGAGLDVFQQEPPAIDNPLFEFENVVLSPHLAGTDQASLEGMGLEAAQCIIELFNGRWPAGAVINEQLRAEWQRIDS